MGIGESQIKMPESSKKEVTTISGDDIEEDLKKSF
jgi:hypothetical protein